MNLLRRLKSNCLHITLSRFSDVNGAAKEKMLQDFVVWFHIENQVDVLYVNPLMPPLQATIDYP